MLRFLYTDASFTGTAIYLLNILANGYLTDVNITLDGEFASRFTHSSTIDEPYEYNTIVFSQTGLPYGEHSVGMSASGPDDITVLFDYAIYT